MSGHNDYTEFSRKILVPKIAVNAAFLDTTLTFSNFSVDLLIIFLKLCLILWIKKLWDF